MAGAAQAALRKNSISRRESVTSRGVWGQSPPQQQEDHFRFLSLLPNSRSRLGGGADGQFLLIQHSQLEKAEPDPPLTVGDRL